MIDWIGPAVRLFAMVAIVGMPIGLVLAVVNPAVLSARPELQTIALVAAWLWFAVPVGLLSSMSVGSMFAVVRPAVVWDLIRVFPSTLVFYLVTGAGFYGAVRLWDLSLLHGYISLIPVTAVASAWGVLVYARLLGRLGWVMNQLQVAPRKKRPPGKLKPSLRKKISVSDPWAAPPVQKIKPKPKPKPVPKREVEEDDEDGPATAYGLTDDPLCRAPKFELIEGSPFLDVKGSPSASSAEEPPQTTPRRIADDDDDGGEIQIAPDDVPAPEAKPHLEVTPSALDLRLTRNEEPAAPAHPMFSGVYDFPIYLSSLKAFVMLSLSWLIMGGWIEVLIVLFPFKDK
jgi:hypothetical protein